MQNDVRELRTAAGLSQQQLGDALEVSRQTINSIEKERYMPVAAVGDRDRALLPTTVEEIFHADH
jgi:putative transcriptional regulator